MSIRLVLCLVAALAVTGCTLNERERRAAIGGGLGAAGGYVLGGGSGAVVGGVGGGVLGAITADD